MPELSERERELAEPAQSVIEDYYEEQDVDLPWGTEFGGVYIETGNTISYNNNVIHVSTMLTLVSRALKHTRIRHGNRQLPPVIHTLAIQKSGTGKSPALNYAWMVGEEAGYDVRMSGDLTSGGLIGGVRDGEVVSGIANKYHIIGFDEASTLFRIARGDHSANFAEHLNNILDSRNVTKDLATGNLDYEPRCALTGVTYPPDDIDYQHFMNNGTLSRFFVFYRPVDSDIYRSTSREILRGARTSEPDVNESIANVRRLGTVIQAIRFHYDDGFQFNHQFGKDTEDLIMNAIYDTSEEYSDEVQELLKPDRNRMIENTLKIGTVFAALDHCSEIVNDSHMRSAVKLVERSWRQTLDFFESHYQTGNTRNEPALSEATIEMLKTLLRNDVRTQSEIAEDIDRSNRMVREYASELESLDLIEEVTKEGKKGYRLKSD